MTGGYVENHRKKKKTTGNLHSKVRAGSPSDDQAEAHRARVTTQLGTMVKATGYAFKDLQLFVSWAHRNSILQ